MSEIYNLSAKEKEKQNYEKTLEGLLEEEVQYAKQLNSIDEIAK